MLNNKKCKFSVFITSGVNFINVFTPSFYTCRSRERKKLPKLTVFFALLGFACVKAACKMLVKLSPDHHMVLRCCQKNHVLRCLKVFCVRNLRISQIFYWKKENNDNFVWSNASFFIGKQLLVFMSNKDIFAWKVNFKAKLWEICGFLNVLEVMMKSRWCKTGIQVVVVFVVKEEKGIIFIKLWPILVLMVNTELQFLA